MKQSAWNGREGGLPNASCIAVLLDSTMPDADRIIETAFGKAGLTHLAVMRTAIPGGVVVMVGRPGHEPARVIGCRTGDDLGLAVDAGICMARRLGSTSAWLVHLPADRRDAVVALLADRSETVGVMQ